MRKKRVEIFFVLYLTALVGFVVVSKERDKHDLQIEREKNEFLHSFLQPVSFELPNDTLWWYADIPEGTKAVQSLDAPLITDLKIYDIGSTDSVTVKVTSVTHNNLLVSPRLVEPIGRVAYGDLADRIVKYPMACKFALTGVYTVTFSVKSKRFHAVGNKSYYYRDVSIPRELLPYSVLRDIESTDGVFTVIVEDTSLAKPVDVPNMTMELEKQAIESALGFHETNLVTVNLGFYNPSVRVVEGPGVLERVEKASKTETYVWTGPVRKYPYTVTIEARVDRDAGGKDIARQQFTVSSKLPYLVKPKPGFAYSGETFEVDVQVEGLSDQDSYSWELYESAGSGALLKKLSGKGSKVRYHVPTGFAGKRLVIQALYRDLPYLQFDRASGTESTSQFVFPVINPPVHIELPQTTTLYTTGLYRFTAYQYSQPEFRFDQPVMNLSNIDVQLTTEDGKLIRTNSRMNSPGRFEFAVVYQGEIPYEGISAKLQIAVNDVIVSRIVKLKK